MMFRLRPADARAERFARSMFPAWLRMIRNNSLQERQELKISMFALLAASAIAAVSAFALPFALDAAEAPSAVEHKSALPASGIPEYIVAAVNSPERPVADKKSDQSRRPDQSMTFFGIRPGMQVADLSAGGGYTTELLARIVGPSGKVYSQNQEFPEKFKNQEQLWQTRTKEPGMANIVEVTKPFDAPDLLPVPPNTLDAVLINLNYHDLVGRGYDRSKLNAAVFKALKPGGVYGIVDNSAQAGSGARDTKTLHRIDEAFVVKEVEQAGFKLAADSDIFRNPKDDRTLHFSRLNHMQDRFVLKFVKP
jgi:predicted methyltransferase